MAKILNFGSLNIDKVYQLDEIIKKGATEAALGFEEFVGGKGLNQTIALKKAGADVYHAGCVGDDGEILIDFLRENKINSMVKKLAGKSGHTIIQVARDGGNSIIVVGGANKNIDQSYIDEVFKSFGKGDYLLIQNEVNNLAYIIDSASKKEMQICFNPSPIDDTVEQIDFTKIHTLIINEIEGARLSGCESASDIIDYFAGKFPALEVVLTLGADGGIYKGAGESIKFETYPVEVVDTTAAGDTFLGFYLAKVAAGWDKEMSLDLASLAAALACTKKGAANSIPSIKEIEDFANERNLELAWKN